ncbi:hypothetical protein Adt_24375 [Abeliophyllum distichum]|uniref:Uncharacterized protein n=1 Tax=Abeliophyllum distichum TaxID=126358 RepID=A0ABD1SE03_9LAMI
MSGADYHNITLKDLDHPDFELPPPHLLCENDDDDEEQAWRIIGCSLSVGPRLHNLQNQSETDQTSTIKGDILVKDDGFHMKCYRESLDRKSSPCCRGSRTGSLLFSTKYAA